MNILFIASFRISPNSGGVQRVTETLAKEFKAIGYNVYYLSFSKGNKEQIKGIDQYYLPNGTNYNSSINKNYLRKLVEDRNINIIVNQIGFSVSVLEFIRENSSLVKIFSVHHNCLKCLNDQYHNIYEATLKSKGFDKIFNNKIGWFVLKRLHKYRFGKDIKKSIQLSDKIVLLSDRYIPELNFYTSKYDNSKVLGMPNPLPFDKKTIKIPAKENKILYVGRLSIEQKRVERLLEIWESIYTEFPDWEFDILGDGFARSMMEEEVKNKKIKRVNFYGFQDPRLFLEKSKIFILPSDFEGFPMVLVEAQSHGVVPITFNSFTAVKDIIDNNVSGLIIENFNVKAFTRKLVMMMGNEEKIASMSKESINSSIRFDSSKLVNKWVELFNKN